MYFTDISNNELLYFRNLKVPNFTIKLSDILHQTSGSYDNKLFKIEEIITDTLYRIFPMFYTGEITSSNPLDHIIDNKVIVCKKETSETYISFISNPEEPIQDYVSYASYFSIEDSLTDAQFNSIVDLLRTNTVHKDSFKIKQGLVTGEWANYTFDIDGTTIVDNGILVTDETLTSLGTVLMTNPKFHYATYTLKLKVYHMTDINVMDTSEDNIVVDTLSIVLKEDELITIPFNTLDYSYVVGFDATVEIKYDIPVIPDIPKYIYLSTDKPVIQTGEKSDITATVKDCGGVLVGAGHDIYFYEEYEPYSIILSSDKSIIQTNDKADIKATLKDEDGSLIAEEDIYFYQSVTSLKDPLTSDNNLILLTDSNASLTYSSSGVKFKQDSGENNSTLAYFPILLDVVNKSYEISFDVMDWSTTDNTPYRCVAYSKDLSWSFGNLPLQNVSAGYLILGEWKYSNPLLSQGDTIKIHLEDGNYKVYLNGSLRASSTATIDEEIYFGFTHWVDQYTTIKNFNFKEL